MFRAPVTFQGAVFDGTISGGPVFQGPVDFSNVKCDGLNLDRAEFWQISDFSGLNFVTDSWISICEFRELALFQNCSIWELHFRNNRFLKGLSLLGSSGRISLTGYTYGGLLDLREQWLFMGDLQLTEFRGVLRLDDARCDGAVAIERSVLGEGSGLERIRVGKTLTLSSVEAHGSLSLNQAVVEGGRLSLTDVSAAGGLDLSSIVLGDPADLTLIRVSSAHADGPRLLLAGTVYENGRFADVDWPRSALRLRLSDEDELDANPARARELIYTYRRLRTYFERAHMQEEAEDCVWAAMEMRRKDPQTSWLSWLVLFLYEQVSHYGSRFERALGVLGLLLLVFFPIVFAAVGLRPTGTSASVPSVTQARPSGLLQHLVGTVGRYCGPCRAYGQGLVHTLEVASFRDETRLTTQNLAGAVVEAVARAASAGQLAILLLAIRRRYGR